MLAAGTGARERRCDVTESVVRSLSVRGKFTPGISSHEMERLVLATGVWVSQITVDYEGKEAYLWITGTRSLEAAKKALSGLRYVEKVVVVDTQDKVDERSTANGKVG